LNPFAGILDFRGRTADESDCSVLTGTMGLDEVGQCTCVRDECIAIAYLSVHRSPELSLEHQPLRSSDGHLIAFDGRLDNRGELLRGIGQSPYANYPDAHVVLSVYDHFAQDSFSKLIGDFAFALWDARRKELFLVRDPFGTRILYYQPMNDAIRWSTKLNHLLTLAPNPPEVNDEYLYDFFLGQPCLAETPYKGIFAVQPGSCLVVKNTGIRNNRYWRPDPNHRIRYKSDRDYEEHFRHIFEQSVRNRLQVNGVVCAELSGGLDSSSIVCVADELIKKGEVPARRLVTISCRYDESKSADEYEFIDSVEEKIGRRGAYVWESELRMFSQLPTHPLGALPNIMAIFGRRHELIANAMKACDAKVLLRGTGGDHLMLSQVRYPPDLADCLARGDLFGLHRTILTWAQVLPFAYAEYVLRGALAPLIPRWVNRVTGHSLDSASHSNVHLFTAGFSRRMRGRKHLQEPLDDFGFTRPPSSRLCAFLVSDLIRLVSTGAFQQEPYELSMPFVDRPLIEFCLAIPIQQKVRHGVTRSLQRRALGSLLPPLVAARTTKGNFVEATARAWAREVPGLMRSLQRMQVCSRDYIDSQRFFVALSRTLHGYALDIDNLSRVLLVEFWLRRIGSPSTDRTA
jgi:asparagine synthase (glutamine-hydrolysing)